MGRMWGRRATLVLDDVREADEVEAPPAVEVRRLRADEGALLRRVRLASILEAPVGQPLTLNEAMTFDDAYWDRRAAAGACSADRQVWIALGEDTEHPVGIIGGNRTDEAIEIDVLWLAPALRGQVNTGHVADHLLRPMTSWADSEGLATDLWVHETNHRAIHYARRVGFRPTGVVKNHPLLPGGLDLRLRLQNVAASVEVQAASGK